MLKWRQSLTCRKGEIDMKTCIALTVLFWGILLGTSVATIYQYVDDKGEEHFTNDLSSVPQDKLDQVTEIEETQSNQVAPAPAYSGPIYPLLQDLPTNEDLKRQRNRLKKKEQLEAEYETLLKEKEALENDASFQKRRNKTKYQNRPYIQELVKKETRINQRLAELERQLRAY